MKSLIVGLLFVSASVSARGLDAGIYNNLNVGNTGQPYVVKPYMMNTQIGPTHQSANIQTVESGNTAYTTGTDSNGNSVNCRTTRAGHLTNTVCD